MFFRVNALLNPESDIIIPMKTESERIPITVIVGPTAVGKTAYAIQLAKQIDGEIVSADSRYFFRGMTIGTAKPTPEEMDGVRHHLIDVSDPDDVWSLARFQSAADSAIRDIHARGKRVIVAGGTGQYIRALLQGWAPPELEARPDLRRILETIGRETGAKAFHEKLARIDPDAAAHIEYQNLRRTVRAFEVIFSTGRKFSDQRRITDPPYDATVIGLIRNRAELYARIDQRIDAMIENGFIEEVETLLKKGYEPTLPAMSAIGYPQIAAVLRGEMTLDEARALIRKGTHAYVRRQANWFKPDDPMIRWIDLSKKETS